MSAPLGRRAPELPRKTVRRAAILSDQVCETILRGISLRLKSDRRTRTFEHGICHVDVTVLDGNDDMTDAITQCCSSGRLYVLLSR